MAIQKKTNQKDLQHEVTVTLKLIQVYVTDKDGNSVMDLGIDDFEIYDKNRRMELTEFEKYTLMLPSDEKKSKEPIVKPKSMKEIVPQEKMTRKFFIFFDFAYNNATGFKKSKEAALHFIDTQLHPTDEVGVLSYSSLKSLVLHEYLTTDHWKVREVVDGFGVRNVLGRAENVEARYWEQGESPYADYGMKFGIPGLIELDRRVSKNNAIDYSLIIRELGKALRYIPGQKHIILFSSGIASSLIYGHSPRVGAYGKGSFGDSAIRNRYENMMKELAASNSPVFALDTEELGSAVMRDDEATGQRSLKKLAKVTGGRYYDNLQNYEKIMDEIQTMTGSYYVLGYYIDEKWDGKYHKIKVTIKKKGYDVHAQGGYYNPKPFNEYSKLEKQIHLVDLALTERPLFQDPIRFPLEVSHSPGEEKGNLCLVSQIPVEKFEEISGERVEIVSLVFDEKDDIVAFDRVEMDFSKLPDDEFQHTCYLSIPPGEYKCRVVIRNLKTGRGAVGSTSVVIPKD
jgi:VWFA-related protein